MSRTFGHVARTVRHDRHKNTICVGACNFCHPRSPGRKARLDELLKTDAATRRFFFNRATLKPAMPIARIRSPIL
jgi:hypothetical protein